MKFYVHTHVIRIHILFKLHVVPIIGYLIMANYMDLNQFKGNNSCITKARLTNVDVRQRVIMIYIYFKFH